MSITRLGIQESGRNGRIRQKTEESQTKSIKQKKVFLWIKEKMDKSG
jgi:hypothetical protein